MDLQIRKNALECARQSGVSCPSTLSLYKFYTLATAKEAETIKELNELRLSAAMNHDTVVDMLHTQYQEKIQTLELEVVKWELATQKNADCIRGLTKQCAELVQEKKDLLLFKRAN